MAFPDGPGTRILFLSSSPSVDGPTASGGGSRKGGVRSHYLYGRARFSAYLPTQATEAPKKEYKREQILEICLKTPKTTKKEQEL